MDSTVNPTIRFCPFGYEEIPALPTKSGGNVMLHASPGFITLVDTPTLGAVTMIGEEALDF